MNQIEPEPEEDFDSTNGHNLALEQHEADLANQQEQEEFEAYEADKEKGEYEARLAAECEYVQELEEDETVEEEIK